MRTLRHRRDDDKEQISPELRINPDEPDWDYSVAVVHPVADIFEQLLHGELYNSIIEEEDLLPVRCGRQTIVDRHSMCRTRTTLPEPESLFYHTYRHSISRPKKRPEPIFLSSVCAPNVSPRDTFSFSSPVSSLDSSPKSPVHNATPKIRNTVKHVRTITHGSTIPPPSCPMASFPMFHTKQREKHHCHQVVTPPVSITDIFEDLKQLQDELDAASSLASTSIASTTLASCDTRDYSVDDGHYCTDVDLQHDYNHDTDGTHKIRTSRRIIIANDGNRVFQWEERDESEYVFPGAQCLATDKKDTSLVAIHHQGQGPDRDKRLVIIDNDGKQVFRWDGKDDNNQLEHCFFIRHCPMATEI